MKSILFIFLLTGFTANQNDFYTVFSNESLEDIETKISQLEGIKNKTIIDKAYIAALTMKKSNFEKDLKKKINTFKTGALDLEELIDSNPKNIELRFIRLIIQEKSPKILKYNTDIDTDALLIKAKISTATTNLQKEIRKYSLVSEHLSL